MFCVWQVTLLERLAANQGLSDMEVLTADKYQVRRSPGRVLPWLNAPSCISAVALMASAIA